MPVTNLTIVQITVPQGTLNQPYDTTLTAVGGQSPYTWSLESGSLPLGCSINSSTGEITGTPLATGYNSFVIAVHDSAGNQFVRQFAINVESFPLGLDCTLMGQYSNSYCDVAFADNYFSQIPSTVKQGVWNALTDDQKAMALIQATYTIEQYCFTIDDYTVKPNLQYNPITNAFSYGFDRTVPSCKYNPFQMLQFPRNKDVYANGGIYIPVPVQMAECEQAIYETTFDDSILSLAMQGVGHNQLSVGDVHIRQEISTRGTPVAPMALKYLRSYLINRSRRNRRA